MQHEVFHARQRWPQASRVAINHVDNEPDEDDQLDVEVELEPVDVPALELEDVEEPESLLDDAALLDDVEAGEASPPALLLSRLRFLSPPFLKSVSYQPPPLRRKPAAEIFFLSVSPPHAGQVFSGSSLIFCMVSNSCAQSSQRYS